MPKLKTRKAISKRFKITGKNKIKQRKCGQDHFNSKEPGKVTRAKRLDRDADTNLKNTLKKLMPYS